MLIEIDDDDEANPGPMPQLEDMNPYLSGLRAQLEAADKEEAQLRAVRRQKDDALQAQKIYQARLAEEASKARDKELAASVAKSALLAEIERAKSVEAAPEPETISPRSVAMPPPYAAWRLNAAPVTLDLAWRGDANVDDVPPPLGRAVRRRRRPAGRSQALVLALRRGAERGRATGGRRRARGRGAALRAGRGRVGRRAAAAGVPALPRAERGLRHRRDVVVRRDAAARRDAEAFARSRVMHWQQRQEAEDGRRRRGRVRVP